jgi:hypothetical protein
MKLREWVKQHGRGELTRLRAASGVGWASLWRAKRGVAVSYAIAKKISLATNGAVSIAELCDGATVDNEERAAA